MNMMHLVKATKEAENGVKNAEASLKNAENNLSAIDISTNNKITFKEIKLK